MDHDRSFERFVFGRHSLSDSKPKAVAFQPEYFGWSGSAQSYCGIQDCLQHRLQIEGRAADDLEHIASRGLIFERLLQITRTLLQFAKQPRVLDRNDRLRREILQERDLLVGKGPDFLAINVDRPEQFLVPS